MLDSRNNRAAYALVPISVPFSYLTHGSQPILSGIGRLSHTNPFITSHALPYDTAMNWLQLTATVFADLDAQSSVTQPLG